MADRQRVFVTGMGCLSGLGQGIEENWAGLIASNDAARPFKRAAPHNPDFAFEGVAAWMEPPDFSAFAMRYDTRMLRQMDNASVYALLAAHEALDDTGLLDQPDLLSAAAILVGTGAGGAGSTEDSYSRLFGRGLRLLHPMTIPRQMPSASASQLSIVFGARGPSFVIASACASSAHAIAEGAAMIRAGRVDLAIVGGTEAPLLMSSCLAWQSMHVVAEERCRPFSLNRDGMILGEGAAMLVLESERHAAARGAIPRAELLGSGASSDAHHITQINGQGAVAAIRAALVDSGVDPQEPMLISSHGTGTLLNDRVEATALRTVFGASLDGSAVIATKSAHGHLLGAGGAIELILGLIALEKQVAPPILNYLGDDPECALPLVLKQPRKIGHRHLLSNSFAFGGTNAVLIARGMV